MTHACKGIKSALAKSFDPLSFYRKGLSSSEVVFQAHHLHDSAHEARVVSQRTLILGDEGKITEDFPYFHGSCSIDICRLTYFR